jgi:hypothetical protein
MRESRAKDETQIFESGEGAADVRRVLEQMRERFGEEVFKEVLRQMQGLENGGDETEAEFADGDDAGLDGGGADFAENAEPVRHVDENKHVIDIGGRLRRAWRFWQFRLFVLAVVQATGAVVLLNGGGIVTPLLMLLNWLLFALWSVALFRKRGLGQLLLKWLIYFAAVAAGGGMAFNMAGGGIPAPVPAQEVFGGSLLAALLLTLSKISDWMGEWIRAHVWQSHAVRTVRRFFV